MQYCQEEKSFPYSIANYLSLTLSYLAEALSDGFSEVKGSYWRLLEVFLDQSMWSKILGEDIADQAVGFMFKLIAQKGIFFSYQSK